MISEGVSAEKAGRKPDHLRPFAGRKPELTPSLTPYLTPSLFPLFSYVYVKKGVREIENREGLTKCKMGPKSPKTESLQRSRENGPTYALFTTAAFRAAENRR